MKFEYLVNFSQYFENFTKSIIGSCNKTFLRKVSKTLAKFDEVFIQLWKVYHLCVSKI